MTRKESALDRHDRHSAFVQARRERAVAQAPDDSERVRLAARLLEYEQKARADRAYITRQITAYHEHMLRLQLPTQSRKSWKREQHKERERTFERERKARFQGPMR